MRATVGVADPERYTEIEGRPTLTKARETAKGCIACDLGDAPLRRELKKVVRVISEPEPAHA